MRRLAAGVALIVLPTMLALGALVIGLVTTSLLLVYLSIGLSIIAVPSFIAGIFVLVRRRTDPRGS